MALHHCAMGDKENEADKESQVESQSQASQASQSRSAAPSAPNSDRERWGSSIQFILTCIGYAVGLGNIWRFPSLAYENGGGAFLIPYIICSLFFGLPLLYFEFCIGQYLQSGPSVAFFKFRPVLQGIGWTMAFVSMSVGIYYNVIISWVSLYMLDIVTGQSYKWTSCKNEWNSMSCVSHVDDLECARDDALSPFYYNGSCVELRPDGARKVAAEEYFERAMLDMISNIDNFGGINPRLFFALLFVWIVIGAGLWKGVRYIGKISLVTATMPYVIIAILFVRGVTLPNAIEGINFYLLKPDFSFILSYKTWRAALTQVCFSLSVGFGGLLSMASYNPRTHNCFRDAIFVALADSGMSIFGGVAVFSTMGFLAQQQQKPVTEVISSGTSLAFVAYPEAMAQMSLSWFWAILFFLMLFLLGVSTQFVYTETMATSLLDQFSSLKKYRVFFIIGTCFVMFSVGILMCTRAGMYWFILFNEYTGSFSVCVACVAEIVCVMYIYGMSNWRMDLYSMFGRPETKFGEWFGKTGNYFMANWLIVSPLLGSLVFVFSCWNSEPSSYGAYSFPAWADTTGWLIGAAPALCLPLFAIINIIIFACKGNIMGAFRLHPSHHSYARICEDVTTCRPVSPIERTAKRAESLLMYTQPKRAPEADANTSAQQ